MKSKRILALTGAVILIALYVSSIIFARWTVHWQKICCWHRCSARSLYRRCSMGMRWHCDILKEK